MNKNEKIIKIGIASASVIIVISIMFVGGFFNIDKQSENQEEIINIEELVMSNIFSLSMENVYATGECSEVIQDIKDRRLENLNKSRYKNGEISWYAAGLVLAAHYVVKDCDSADRILDEYLNDLKIVDKDHDQSDIRDDIASSFRYVKSLLKG